MLVLVLFLAVCATSAHTRTFNITYLDVPLVVPSGQHDAVIECRYDANFTLLSWFKGPNEFFRYRPGAAPSTRSFPILGIGSVEMLACGPTACILRLGALTEDATGLYGCNIEREVPPYKFATRTAHMEVYGPLQRKPLLEGLAEEYRPGELIQAYCRGGPHSEFRWYINGREVADMVNSTTFKMESSRYMYMGVPPKVSVQCAEFRHGKIFGSAEKKARWNEVAHIKRKADDNNYKVISGSNVILGRLSYLSIVLCLLEIKKYVF